jgi:hypothetical protein
LVIIWFRVLAALTRLEVIFIEIASEIASMSSCVSFDRTSWTIAGRELLVEAKKATGGVDGGKSRPSAHEGIGMATERPSWGPSGRRGIGGEL